MSTQIPKDSEPLFTPPTASRLLLEEEIPGGAMWSHVLHRHQSLRLTDLEGGANASVLLYNRDLLTERYNMPDTLKSQHTLFLTKGVVMCSDMGRILCSITEDRRLACTVTGVSDAAAVKAKYGDKTYQQARNDYHRSGRDCLLNELSKWGLGARDLVPNANFFTKVAADAAGKLAYVSGHSKAGAFVDLRAEMNVLVVMTSVSTRSILARRMHEEGRRPVWKSDPPKAMSVPEARPRTRGLHQHRAQFLGCHERAHGKLARPTTHCSTRGGEAIMDRPDRARADAADRRLEGNRRSIRFLSAADLSDRYSASDTTYEGSLYLTTLGAASTRFCAVTISRHCGPSRHPRRRMLGREQTVRYGPTQAHACVSRHFCSR